ncbi:hypothetical protein J8L98_23130 [Pseudoalteromonas sp. MMG013]|uniref:hypothetical protein n=1 Tax=Pseudoalteromonas sp. MMG013 TaxID=2822687 RepID=UPI001B35B2F7|nr:hypothetical protein [Pseudoalteromonas sp. MMG013]MBQ4864580.1 hypothetical protein [Pseudoalteromonas sp. MMG013]
MSGKLMRASQWAKREFTPGSIPTARTLRQWVENGVVEGRIIDGAAFIFDTEKAGLNSQVSSAVNSLLKG